jgi:hypothetical protein
VIRRSNGVESQHVPLDSDAPVLELSQLTDFVEFFYPVFEHIRSYHWLLDDVTFAPPQDWDEQYDLEADRHRGAQWDAFFGEIVASHQSLRVATPGFLEKYAAYICDDWCDIVGLAECPPDPQGFLEAYVGGPMSTVLPHLDPPAEVAFFCIDGVRWEVFASGDAIVARVRDHLGGRGDLAVNDLALRDSVA